MSILRPQKDPRTAAQKESDNRIQENMSPVYDLWRQDDNGNRFFVQTYVSLTEGQEVRDNLESKNHKQLYLLVTRSCGRDGNARD